MQGHLGVETFVDAQTFFANRSIHMYVAHAIKARQQWMLLQDLQLQQGWFTSTDRKIRQWLVKMDRLRVRMIHTAGNQNQKLENHEALAKGMNLELPAVSTDTGLGDGIAQPAGRAFEMRNRLDGADPNVPKLSDMTIRNIDGLTLMTALDLHIVTATRLDSRMSTHRITGEEGAMLFVGLLEMWKLCDESGGDAKVVGITEGTLPTEEPQGFGRSGAIVDNRDVATRPGVGGPTT